MDSSSSQELAELLDALAGFVRRFVVMTIEQVDALALYVAHTHATAAAQATPYLVVTSAEKRSGKTRLLEVLELVVARPLRTVNMSEPALFRSLENEPTLLFDEVDAIFGPRAREHEDLRALLNGGYRRGAKVHRCVGDGSRQRVAEFEAFSPKVLAGIGAVPDTVADRALAIRLKRKAPSESAARFRLRFVSAEASALRARLEELAAANLDALESAEPALPEELDDRAQDVVEPLLAIADLAGADWPERGRRAVVALRMDGSPEDSDSLGIRMLADVRGVFDTNGTDRVSSQELVSALKEIEDAPWADWHGGRGLTPRVLASRLRPYAIRSRTIRLESGETPKGYLRDSFEDTWKRYLPSNGFGSATPATTAQPSRAQAFLDSPQHHSAADIEPAPKAHEQTDAAQVADGAPTARGSSSSEVHAAGPVPVGDEGFVAYIRSAYRAVHITHDELLERLHLHGVLLRASPEDALETFARRGSIGQLVEEKPA